MSVIYAMALVGVAGMVIAALIESVKSVAASPVWGQTSFSVMRQPTVTVMEGGDRRKQQLPFVGVDRRKAAVVENRKVG